ncbi:hypothetical protein ACEV8V_22935 [Vibrio parahaemolyticus]
MSKKVDNKQKSYRSRASLSQSKHSHLSYSERMRLSNKGKECCGVDLNAKVDTAGYISIQ